jgi:hypothetical protein
MMPQPRTGILSVNGHNLPDPKGITWSLQDLDAEEGTGRNQEGKAFRDRVAVKRKLQITFTPMNVTDMSDLLSYIDDEFFSCTYFDAKDGNFRTSTMYVGDRVAPMLIKDPIDKTWIWDSLTCSFIEQ